MPIAIPMPEGTEGTHNEHRPTGAWMLFVGPMLVLLSAANYIWMSIAGRGFADLFAGFGDDMPVFSELVLAASPYFGAMILIGLIPCIALFRNRALGHDRAWHSFKWIIAGFGASLTVGVIFAAAMYLPIFQMAESL